MATAAAAAGPAKGGSSAAEVNIDSKNYMRLLNLLQTIATNHFRQQFCQKWFLLEKSEWRNLEENGGAFIEDFGASLYNRSQQIQKKFLKTGNINTWDLPLLLDAIKCLQSRDEMSNTGKGFEKLKKLRNKLSHLGSLEMSDEKFNEDWQEAAEVLVALGVERSCLEKAKSAKLGQQEEVVVKLISSENKNKEQDDKADRLKEVGNGLYKSSKYAEAIDAYSRAILLPGLPTSQLAILYANRSISYLKAGEPQCAKDDAKGAIHLRPNWWKGYARLANAYIALESYDKALRQCEIALGLDPTAGDVKEPRDFCRHMLAKLARQQHMDPMYYTWTHQDNTQEMNKRGGPTMTVEQLKRSEKLTYELGLPLGICAEAHNYLHGRGVGQNYEIAATLFGKAAAKGNAEGMYNLGMLTREGKGVMRSISEAHKLLLQAACQEPTIEAFPGARTKLPNIGVMEAQHSLGLAFQEGVGVEADLAKAIEWYEKALLNGSGSSANNLAIIYGALPFAITHPGLAFLFWKVGSVKGTVRAMENLATNYLDMGKLELAQKWYNVAVRNGSVSLPLRKSEFQFEKRPLDGGAAFSSEDFLASIKEELMAGPMKRFLRPSAMDECMDKMAKMSSSTRREQPKGPLSPDYRTQITLAHRTRISTRGQERKSEYSTSPAQIQAKPTADIFGLKPILIKDMKEAEDHIYEGYAIKLTLIEDAFMYGAPSIGLIGQDEAGDVQRLFIYNYPQNKETQAALGYGSTLTIVHPYFRIMADQMAAIRLDDPTLLFLNSKARDERRCRYCGQANGGVPCRKCKRVFYCSKLCMKKDAQLLQHHLVCIKHL